jgi:hydrogenase maturation protein HypF
MLASVRARRSIAVEGVVQGVGFRPFVHGLASRLGLGGFVCNRAGGVLIEVEGESQALERFLEEVRQRPPPLARIEEITWLESPPRGEARFHIEESSAEPGGAVQISPDVATCEDCLREMLDPGDRRFRHPFLNCTNCGPRLTVVTGAPYDRERTTMARFALCPDCSAEYHDPSDRRFHAQPTCCPRCGPTLQPLDSRGAALDEPDPVAFAARELSRGRIGAIKGVGGYHLACDARSEPAVSELRRRKARDEKPFAMMVRDLAAAAALCRLSPEERALLASPARPIVLLDRREGGGVAASVAPRSPQLGLMLPYAPLQHLILREVGGPLVMTSGNRSDEPIAHDDRDALERLSGIADFFLVHDRPIHTRCDDSVLRVAGNEPLPVRRSRGYAPLPIRLPLSLSRPALALGGQLKATFALGAAKRAFVSHHLGDLDHPAALRAWEESIARYQDLCRIEPARVVHDLHPDYASTRWALASGLERFSVQHHHAHFASCLAENGFVGPALGVCFDGTGYGLDGTIWGGEFLAGDIGSVVRAAHLLPVPMPGGERAIREPWRMAVAHLRAAGEDDALPGVDPAALSAVRRMLERSVNSPLTSSMGRLFDAIAAIAGACASEVSYEGQAAVALEWLATGLDPDRAYPVELFEQGDRLVVDTRPVVAAALADARAGAGAARIGRRFHSTVVEMIAAVCGRLRQRTGLATVALSGGVFVNAILAREAAARLEAGGFQVLRHRVVPPNDGGLCLGQLAAVSALDRIKE